MKTTFTTHDGLALHVHLHGPDDAPLTVVLSHCWTADEYDWYHQVIALLSRFGHGVRLLLWDHRGHGASDAAPQEACTLGNLGRDMAGLIDRFAPTGPLVLAGHSIGGMTMMELGAQRPDLMERVRGALFCSTAASGLENVTLGLPEVGPRAKAQIPHMLARRAEMMARSKRRHTPRTERLVLGTLVFGKQRRTHDLALAVDQLINCPPATMSGFFENMMGHDRRDALKAYAGIPTLVLVGGVDRLTPPDRAREIAAGIDGARLLIAPEAGHMLPYERDELVSEALIQLIEGALL